MFSFLYNIILSRKEKMPSGSYIASLFKEDADRIIQKVGEEAVEVVIASKNKNKELLISELSDLFFHIFVLMVSKGVKIKDIEDELERRHSSKKDAPL